MVQGAPKAEPQFVAAPVAAAYVQPSAAVVERSKSNFYLLKELFYKNCLILINLNFFTGYHGNFAYPQYVSSNYVASPYVASPYVASPYAAAYTAPILYR